MEPFYRTIFKRAWNISWKHKWLWFFGFFATFLGNGTFYEAIARSFSHMSEGRSIYYTLREYVNTGIFSTFSWSKMLDLWQKDNVGFGLSVFVMLILLALAATVIILAIVSQVGLVRSAIGLDEHKKIGFKQAFHLGVEKFWPVFGMNVVTRVVMFGIVLFLAFVVSMLLVNANWINYILYIVSFILLLIAGIIIYFVSIYATAFIVLRHKNIRTSLIYAWHLFKNNVLLNLEVGFLLFVINILVGMAAVILAVFALSPFILLYLLMILLSVDAGLWILSSTVIVLMVVILILTGSWFTAFQISVWSILFEELALNRGHSKLIRLIERALPKHRKGRRTRRT
ncbi:TPA: hypothetical protein DF272_04355 [Candidatus Falkowbacteria bacterium]|nr:hypothetical protein [Candidatus Falkowbacteria bacterium]